MKWHKYKWLFFMLLVVQSSGIYSDTYYGKNKVQYNPFEWSYIQSRHFDVYYTTDGFDIARFVADVAEESYLQLKEDLHFELEERVRILVYNSHNDFEQTNASSMPPDEAVGGFTEFFKTRVVIPYDGDWASLRHVTHHELTHAVMMQMVFGSGVGSALVGMARFQMPLWLIEGLAEYESRGWDTESDMYIRDAALNNYIYSIDYLNGFMAYKGGQSVLNFIAEEYGRDKIREIFTKIKIHKNMTKALDKSIGLDTKELTERWLLYLRRKYWPDLADRKIPKEIGKQMTHHIKYRNFVNTGPVLNPQGDKIAFISDKSDYFDIYLMSAIDGHMIKKLVSGQKTSNLEELHWLKAGLTWSPDGKNIAFSAKSGALDALHIVNVKKAKITRSFKFKLDGIYNPAWSPKGDKIIFTGTQNGYSDLYMVELKTGELQQITNDVFSDMEPNWSPDGESVVFVSDRGNRALVESNADSFSIFKHDFENTDIYLLHMADQTIEPITATPALEKDPVFAPDGKRIAYTSDACGISNIYVRQIADSVCYPITNALTGIYHLSWATDKIAFASFHNAGYDVYVMERPDSIKAGDITLQPTQFMRSLAAADSVTKQMPPVIVHTETLDIKMETVVPDSIPPLTPLALADMSDKNSGPPRRQEKKRVVALDSTVYLTAGGQYRSKPYKTKFTPDMIYSSASYDQIFGIRAISQFSFSDITGNQQIHLLFNIQEDLRNSSYMLYYMNFKNRLNYGGGAYNYTYYIPGSIDWAKDRNYGATAYLQYPFSKYSRLDYSTQFRAIDRDWVTYPLPEEKRRVFINTLGYVRDTAVWGYTGPKNGGRSAITLNYSPPFFDTSVDFFTVEGDFRKYLRITRDHSFAIRLTGGASFGDEPQRFFLGGVDNWVNQYFQQGIRINDLNDVYFSSFVAPMRAGDYFEQVGTRYLLTNLEWRFPLIHYLVLGWPVPMGFQNIRGSLFTDIGSAWANDEAFHPFTTTAKGWPKLDDMLAAWGMGIRINMGYFLFRLDISWKTDLTRSGSQHKPRYYFSFGIDY